jgi:hypothetical protein
MITKSEWKLLQKEWFKCQYASMQPADAVRARLSDELENQDKLEAEVARLRGDRDLEKRWRKDSDDRAAELEAEAARLRDELAEWHDAAKHVDVDHPDEVHCGCVAILQKQLADARAAFKLVSESECMDCASHKQERDEARTEVARLTVSRRYTCTDCGSKGRHNKQNRGAEPICPACKNRRDYGQNA